MNQVARKIARIKAGFTQVGLAAAVGVSQGYLSALERGAKKPTPELARKIAAALHARPGELFVRDEGAA